MFMITHHAAIMAFAIILLLLPIAYPAMPPESPPKKGRIFGRFLSEPPTTSYDMPGGSAPAAIPPDSSKLNSWFDQNVGSGAKLLAAALTGPPKVIKVRPDGSGDFKTISEAVASIPSGNKKRAAVLIAPGNYSERVRINQDRPYVTLIGEDPKNPPVIVNDGTALKYGTAECGTLLVGADYFNAINLIIVNNAPRPDGKMKDAQGVAVKIRADYGAFYNCKFYGYQDTLFDDKGKHFFKDCYVEGTVDFIFGNGQSLYLNTEIHVIPGDPMAIITAHSRGSATESTGYVFAHCKITGTGGTAYLGRPWFENARVIFAYTEMSDVVNPKGWFANTRLKTTSHFYLGEYNNKGPGANMAKREPFTKKMTAADAKTFLNLNFIEASKWLLPIAKLQAQ